MDRRVLTPAFLVSVVLGAAGQVYGQAGPASGPPIRPESARLVVVLMVDQMRGDYLERWQKQFAEGGFRRLMADGAWFPGCHYPYATTSTGPGHASVLSGTSPATHGIINNNWYDRTVGADVYCATEPRYSLVPPPAKGKASPAGSPGRMLSPTLADSLKATTKGQGKVFGLSLKDRSAILPAGSRPDGVYWFDDRFVTSTFYRDGVHPWVDTFNTSGKADEYFGRPWDKLRSDIDYAEFSGPDDAPGEGAGRKQGTTFPHPVTGGLTAPGPAYYDALANSPFGNDLLLALAKECVTAEQLGRDDTPDLLCLSFSSNDLIGHTWGPDSQEVMDVTLRTDAQVADLLTFLDTNVGVGRYAVVMTADHGVCPLPEWSTGRGQKAARVDTKTILTGAERHLKEAFSGPEGQRLIEASPVPYIYLNRRSLAARKLDPDTVADSLAQWLRGQDGVERVFTRKQLVAPPTADEDAITGRVRKAYRPDRGGDIYVVTDEFSLASSSGSGTSHGTPHDYDTHVPLVAFGPGVAGGRRDDAVTPQHASVIAARFLGVAPPKDNEYDIPASLR